jgi:uncharacterized protein (TIGR02147 family)
VTSRLLSPIDASDRPVLFEYRAVPPYLRSMYQWHKKNVPGFSLRLKTSHLRKCSPSLVSQVMHGKRKLTLDRVEAFGDLFELSAEERVYLTRWVGAERKPVLPPAESKPKRRRLTGQNHLLSHWTHLYVKDSSRLRGFQPSPATIHRLLGGLVSPRQIERSLKFLFREGFLRRTMEGRIVENEVLMTSTDEKADTRIQNFHRKALDVAQRGLRRIPVNRRQASTILLPLNESSYLEVKAKLKRYYEELLEFAEQHQGDEERLYQITIHLTPIGGDLT